MRELTVAASVARALLDFAVSRGADRDALSRRSGISAPELQDADHRIPFSRYVALMRAGQDLCGDPALALHFGECVPVSEISLGSQVGAFSGSMAEGLALFNRYAPLTVEVELGNADRFRWERAEGRIWIIDMRPNPNDFPELTESAFARMVSTGRAMMGDKAPLLVEVHMTHAAPAYRAEYDRIFRAPVVFGSDRNALLTDDSWMSMSPPTPSRPVFDVLRAHSEAQLAKLQGTSSMRERVERQLAALLQSGDASMQAVAGRLGVSRQSLFRKLKAEGVTFEQVLDGLRHALAVRYLDEQDLSVKETAFRLGFSEPASFSRAFKRWTGTSPAGARRGSGTP